MHGAVEVQIRRNVLKDCDSPTIEEKVCIIRLYLIRMSKHLSIYLLVRY